MPQFLQFLVHLRRSGSDKEEAHRKETEERGFPRERIRAEL